jgi:hypothetical protein
MFTYIDILLIIHGVLYLTLDRTLIFSNRQQQSRLCDKEYMWIVKAIYMKLCGLPCNRNDACFFLFQGARDPKHDYSVVNSRMNHHFLGSLFHPILVK